MPTNPKPQASRASSGASVKGAAYTDSIRAAASASDSKHEAKEGKQSIRFDVKEPLLPKKPLFRRRDSPIPRLMKEEDL